MKGLIDPVYLDHAASTPPDPEVVEAMLPWLGKLHANPHSSHFHGQRAAVAVELARARVAELIGAHPDSVIFTSGATESNNLALQGYLRKAPGARVLAATSIEHKSVLQVARALAEEGVEQLTVPVDLRGTVTPQCLDQSLRSSRTFERALVTISHGNSEIGTVQLLQPLAEVSRLRGFRLHVDASQTAGKVPLDVASIGVDFATVASHKLGGPAGIGALAIADDLLRDVKPMLFGGEQEFSMRAGTVPVFLAVGFGVAAELARERTDRDAQHGRELSALFLGRLRTSCANFTLLGEAHSRLPGHLSLFFPDVSADDVLAVAAKSVSASTGSACSAGDIRSSHVLRGVGLSEDDASKVIRVSFGRGSTEEDAHRAATAIVSAINHIQSRDG